MHVLTVRATDRGSPPLWSEATLTVNLNDVNENAHAPAFADLVQTATVRENAPAGTYVTSVKASDADAPGDDSRVSYSIRGGNGQGYFSVDEKGKSRCSSTSPSTNSLLRLALSGYSHIWNQLVCACE